MEDYLTLKSIDQRFNIIFSDNEKEVGELYWDDGILKFKGNMDESAKVFIEHFIGPNLKIYLEENDGKQT